MPTLETTYMGIPLKSPIVVGACSLSNMIERIQRAEEVGAGALVIRSMFEEQIRAEEAALAQGKHKLDPQHIQEAKVYFPSLNEEAAQSHLLWVKKARDATQMPLIASLNAASPGTWATYAQELAKTGVDGLELNIYSVAADPTKSSAQLEEELFASVASVTEAVSIPVAVKLSPFYTSMAYVASGVVKQGAQSLVLFNRFLQPDIRIDDLSLHSEINFSHPDELRLPLRWTAILYKRVGAEIALSTGVHTGKDAIKALLGGAQIVQVASVLYQHGIEHISRLNDDILRWMNNQNFETVQDFRGLVSQQNVDDPFAFERAQYVRLLVSEK